jgi:hypothetical protein
VVHAADVHRPISIGKLLHLQCTIVVHAADAPRPIATGKPLHLQETAVTKPHRIKTCDKKEETQKNVEYLYYYVRWCASLQPPTICAKSSSAYNA